MKEDRSFFIWGSVALPLFVVVHHTPMICNLQDIFLWYTMTSCGHYRGLYRRGAVSIGNSKGVIGAQEGGLFKLCHNQPEE